MIDYLKDIMNEKDYKRVIESAENLGNNPTRSDIEALLQANGGLPDADVTFFLTDPNAHNMQVTYIKELDAYFYTSMALAKDAAQFSGFLQFDGDLTNNPPKTDLLAVMEDAARGVNLIEDTNNHKFLVIYDGTNLMYERLSTAS